MPFMNYVSDYILPYRLQSCQEVIHWWYNTAMRYKITCKNCKQSDVIQIENDTNIIWQGNTYIISGRKRLDLQFGWQCLCGNNDLLTDQEERVVTDKTNPDPTEINQIIKNLEPQAPKFVMDRV